jgi:quercetin dioxygenase-like cupin family protein
MDEILKKLELQNAERDKALKECKKIVNSWDLKLPQVEPSPLHFGLHDFYNTGHIEFDIANNIEEGYCGKLIFMFEGQLCPWHHHNKKHETFFIVKGKIEMETEDEKVIMNQGDHKSISQGMKHRFSAIGGDALILESSKPDLVDDSIFQDERINNIIFGT